jgi:excisionase family DNA binding protein
MSADTPPQHGLTVQELDRERLLPHGLSVREVARRYRVAPSKVRRWLKEGRMRGIDIGENGHTCIRFLAEHLAEFERQRSAAAPPKPPRRKRTTMVDYYPD